MRRNGNAVVMIGYERMNLLDLLSLGNLSRLQLPANEVVKTAIFRILRPQQHATLLGVPSHCPR